MKKFPTAFTILFGLIVVVAALTWIIPAGQYQRAMNETLGKEAPVPGTYALVEPNPQGLGAVLMAPIAGLYDPDTGMANAVDVAVFVLVIGGFLAVVTKTGAIDAGIGRLPTALRGREIWMIPILMTAFALGGTSYGMAEESLASAAASARSARSCRYPPCMRGDAWLGTETGSFKDHCQVEIYQLISTRLVVIRDRACLAILIKGASVLRKRFHEPARSPDRVIGGPGSSGL